MVRVVEAMGEETVRQLAGAVASKGIFEDPLLKLLGLAGATALAAVSAAAGSGKSGAAKSDPKESAENPGYVALSEHCRTVIDILIERYLDDLLKTPPAEQPALLQKCITAINRRLEGKLLRPFTEADFRKYRWQQMGSGEAFDKDPSVAAKQAAEKIYVPELTHPITQDTYEQVFIAAERCKKIWLKMELS